MKQKVKKGWMAIVSDSLTIPLLFLFDHMRHYAAKKQHGDLGEQANINTAFNYSMWQ